LRFKVLSNYEKITEYSVQPTIPHTISYYKFEHNIMLSGYEIRKVIINIKITFAMKKLPPSSFHGVLCANSLTLHAVLPMHFPRTMPVHSPLTTHSTGRSSLSIGFIHNTES